MLTRLDLHQELLKFCKHVYFQPPPTVRMQYPAIVYSLNSLDNSHADNDIYNQRTQYMVTIIDEDPDSKIFESFKKYRRARFSRAYTADQLNHFIFTIYNT